MAQKTVKAKKLADISGEKFEAMETAEILESINLDPAKHKGLRVYKEKIYIGGAHGLNYGEEITAFQVLYNKMIDEGMITGKKIKEDGKYGDETSAAISNLQRQINANTGMGIHEDGYFGIETWSGTYALLTKDTSMLEGVMKKERQKEEIKWKHAEEQKEIEEVPETVKKRPKEEKKTLEDFYNETKKITKKSIPNEKFKWDDAYAKELYEIGIVDIDDSGSYQLSDRAIEYLEKYNKEQKREWKVTETDLEDGINGEKSFTNKYAKALDYIVGEYETAAIPGEGLPGLGEGSGGEYALPEYGVEIPEKIIRIVENEKNEEDKKKMLAALESLKKSENKKEIIAFWLKQDDLKKTLITAGSELAG